MRSLPFKLLLKQEAEVIHKPLDCFSFMLIICKAYDSGLGSCWESTVLDQEEREGRQALQSLLCDKH